MKSSDVLKSELIKTNCIYEGDTPPHFWYAVFRGFLDGTQYAKGWYAVRRNYVIISYADVNFCFIYKGPIFIKKHNTCM